MVKVQVIIYVTVISEEQRHGVIPAYRAQFRRGLTWNLFAICMQAFGKLI